MSLRFLVDQIMNVKHLSRIRTPFQSVLDGMNTQARWNGLFQPDSFLLVSDMFSSFRSGTVRGKGMSDTVPRTSMHPFWGKLSGITQPILACCSICRRVLLGDSAFELQFWAERGLTWFCFRTVVLDVSFSGHPQTDCCTLLYAPVKLRHASCSLHSLLLSATWSRTGCFSPHSTNGSETVRIRTWCARRRSTRSRGPKRRGRIRMQTSGGRATDEQRRLDRERVLVCI